jgi:hypothetical protein
MLIHEALDLLVSLGFVLAGVAPGFMDMRNGYVLQAGGIFSVRRIDRTSFGPNAVRPATVPRAGRPIRPLRK